jgi:glutaredoxin-like protein NrdH
VDTTLAPTITVYTKPQCTNCEKTKKLFDSLGVKYNTIDMLQDKSALSTVKNLGYREAPVVLTPTDGWGGYKEDKIRALAAVLAAAGVSSPSAAVAPAEDMWDF